ncbi:enolase C-terminal domain-like protein [Shigella flexneri]
MAAGGHLLALRSSTRAGSGRHCGCCNRTSPHAGGITECYKIAEWQKAYDVALAPHCPLGRLRWRPACTSTLSPAMRCFRNKSMGIHYNKGAELLDFVKNEEDFCMEGGFFKPLMKPGLGVEIDEAKVIELSKIRRTGVTHCGVMRRAA